MRRKRYLIPYFTSKCEILKKSERVKRMTSLPVVEKIPPKIFTAYPLIVLR
jgi:hypothetical protein